MKLQIIFLMLVVVCISNAASLKLLRSGKVQFSLPSTLPPTSTFIYAETAPVKASLNPERFFGNWELITRNSEKPSSTRVLEIIPQLRCPHHSYLVERERSELTINLGLFWGTGFFIVINHEGEIYGGLLKGNSRQLKGTLESPLGKNLFVEMRHVDEKTSATSVAAKMTVDALPIELGTTTLFRIPSAGFGLTQRTMLPGFPNSLFCVSLPLSGQARLYGALSVDLEHPVEEAWFGVTYESANGKHDARHFSGRVTYDSNPFRLSITNELVRASTTVFY